jgi:hypothetical protein
MRTAPSIIDAAAEARVLLHRLLCRVNIDDELRAEIDAAERALWDALFPGAPDPSADRYRLASR